MGGYWILSLYFCRHVFCYVFGRDHTNYDIQIIVVILKVTTRFFQQRPWEYWENYHDTCSFGVTHAQYELRGLLWFRFGGADSIENNNNIGLSEHLL